MSQFRWYHCFCLSLVFLFACKEEAELPKDILGQEKMTALILDLNIAEVRLLRRNLEPLAQAHQRKSDLEFILKKHEVSDSMFTRSYNFYATHPVEMKKILEEAIAEAERISPQAPKSDEGDLPQAGD